MPQPEWEALECAGRDPTNRGAYLEQRIGRSAPAAPTASVPEIPANHPLAQMPAILPIAGRALLGLAGAYLLRALTESGTLPARAGIAAGIAYPTQLLVLPSTPGQQDPGQADPVQTNPGQQ